MSLSLVSPIQIEVDGVERVEGFQNVQANCWSSLKFTEPLEWEDIFEFNLTRMSLYSKLSWLHILWWNRRACSRAKPDVLFYFGWCTSLATWPVYWAVVLILLPQFTGVRVSFCELVFLLFLFDTKEMVHYEYVVGLWIHTGLWIHLYLFLTFHSMVTDTIYYLYNFCWICDRILPCHQFSCLFTLSFFSTLNWPCYHCKIM